MVMINQNNNYTTSDSIAVYLTGLDSSYNHQNFLRQARWYYRVLDSGENYIGPLNVYGYYTGSDTYVEIDNGVSQSALFLIRGQDINGTITPLQPDTTYDIKCTITYESNGTPITTPPIVLEGAATKSLDPSFRFFYSIGSNEISIGVTGSNYSGTGRVVITCNGDLLQSTYLNYRVTYSGLTPNTSYTFSATIDSTYTISKTLTTQSPSISPFSWTTSNGDATDAQTQAAYTAITSTPKGPTTNFHHLVWNDLVNKVKDVLNEIKGVSWSGTLPIMSDDGSGTNNWKKLTAEKFNSLVYNLNRINTTYQFSPSSVSTGQVVYASYFLDIVTVLNNAINTFNSSS